jgi:hypothetical protein
VSEDPAILITEATRVLANAKASLERGYKTVHDIPARVEEVQAIIAAAQQESSRTFAELERALDEGVSRARERELDKAHDRASWRTVEARQLLGSDDVDAEHQKAVARQVAGLVREEATQKLRAIAARSDDPRLRRTVSEYKEEISRDAHRLLNAFPQGGELPLAEVRKAQAEARKIIDG